MASLPASPLAALAAASLLTAASLGCSSAPSNPTPPVVVSASPIASGAGVGTDFSKVRWRAYDSLAHGFSMPLPEDLAWRVEDRADTWLVATHAPTSTQIVARVFPADALMNRTR